MNSTVIASARGVNRLAAFLDNQQATGLHEVNPAELQAVEGGLIPVAVGIALVGVWLYTQYLN
jgi:lactobin A/cerein 7B family class IIb bacteriocin